VSDPTTDANELAAGTGEDPETVCPPHRWYPTPMAPPMAADALGRDVVAVADLAAEVTSSWPGRVPDVGMVELAGGLRSPMAHDGDGIELVERLDPDLVLLVADAGLGTINSVLLGLDALASRRTVVLLNRFDPTDPLHTANLTWLRRLAEVPHVVSVGELVEHLRSEVLPRFCIGCGRTVDQCAGDCNGPLEAPHHCPICARKLVVTIVPTGVSARCKVHGPIEVA